MFLVHGDEEPGLPQLRVRRQIRTGLHHAGRHPGGLAALHDFRRWERLRPLLDAGVQNRARGAPGRRCQGRVCCPGRIAHHAAQRLPLRVREAGDGHPALVLHRIGGGAGAAVAAVRRGFVIRQLVAAGLGGAAVGEVVEQARPGQIDAHLELGEIDALAAPQAFPGLQRGQDRHRAVQASAVVVVGKADADVRTAVYAGEVGEAGQGVDGGRVGDEIGPRAALPHAGHLQVDDARIGLRNFLVAQAPALHHANREVVDHHVRCCRQPLAEGAALRLPHVQRQRPLVPVPQRVVHAVRAVRPGAGGGVDLHHVRAEVGEHPRSKRPGQHMGEVEHLEAGERRLASGGARWRLRRRFLRRREAAAARGREPPRRGAQAIGRAGAAHGGRADGVLLPPFPRRQLRILGHFGDRQHPAVGRVAALGFQKQRFHLLCAHPLPQYGHETLDVGGAMRGFLVLGIEQVFLRFLFHQPHQLVVEARRRRHHDAAALGWHHGVGVGPVQAAPAGQHRPTGARQPVLVPVPHQHMLQAGSDALVDGEFAPVAFARAAASAQRRQSGDGRVRAGEDEVQLAKGLQRRRVDVAGGGDGAAQSASHQIGREVVAPRAGRAERGHLDDDQRRPPRLRLLERGGVHAESAAAAQHHVCLAHQRRQLDRCVGGFENGDPAAGGEELVPQRRVLALAGVVEGPAAAQRVAGWRLGPHNLRAQVGKQLGAVDGPFVRQVEHAHPGERPRLGGGHG